MKKLLIVDDLPEFISRYKQAAEDLGGFEVYTASCVREGIEKALQFKPDIAILDKNLPDGLGDTIAEKIREVNPQARIAGFTDGNPNDFRKEYFDIREHKVDAEKCKGIIRLLLQPQMLQQQSLTEALHKFWGIIMPDIIALDILVQGYDLAQQARAGIQPIPGVEIPVLNPEKVNTFLDLPDVGLPNPAEFYDRTIQGINELLAQNPPEPVKQELQAFEESSEIRGFMQDLGNKDFLAIEQKCDYKVFHEVYVRMYVQIVKAFDDLSGKK